MLSLEPLLVMANFIRMSWLRVFKSANTAHLGHRGGHEREPRVVPSEKYAARRGSVSDGRHMITACFVRALQRGTSHIYMHFFLTFQEVMPIRQTRNQLMSLRMPLPAQEPHDAGLIQPKWCHRTPGMAAGLTDHVWTFRELLTAKESRQNNLSV